MAFACVYIPDFIAQAVLRSEPALRGRAIAIVEGTAPLLFVVGANAEARRAGIQLGMTKSDAEQFPSTGIRLRAPAQEAATHAALLDLGLSFSPRIEDTAPDTVVLDLEGLSHLFGSSEKIADNLARCASEFGLEAHIAVASNPDAAIHAARGFPRITVIAPGEESERLGCLPVQALVPHGEILETLQRWGVRTLEALAALPTVQLSERLGQEGVRLQELARGASARSLVLAQPPLRFEEVMKLEYSVGELEPLSFILGRLLDQLCSRLAARSLATNALRLQLELEVSAEAEEDTRPAEKDACTSTKYESVLRLPVPMQDSKTLLKLWRLRLQADPPRAPIRKLALAARPAKPRVAQGGLFLPLSPNPEKLEVTLARIASLVGDGNVGSPELLDTHRPGAFRMARFNPLKAEAESRSVKRTKKDRGGSRGNAHPVKRAPAMALRAFRPPLAATVGVRAGVPARVSFDGIRGDVVAVSGPWRTSGDWWRDDKWEHEEWDVEITFLIHTQPPVAGDAQHTTPKNAWRTGLYRLYRDAATGGWFVRGAYD
jgi:protein ImuB